MSDIYKRRKFNQSLKNSFSGLLYTVKTERNARIILSLGAAALILAWVLGISSGEFAIIILTVALVFICEVINTLVEDVIDLFRRKEDHRIKILKDISSAAVFIASAASVGVGIFIFLPKIIRLFR